MTTRPRAGSLDTMDVSQLQDMVRARASTLPREQHQLMSQGGAPEQAKGVWWRASGATPVTYSPSYRAPPGVTEVDITICASGNGTILFTTPVDAVGTEFAYAVVYRDGPSMELARESSTNGVVDDSNGPRGRALTVRSSAVWEHTDVQLTVVLQSASGQELEVYWVSYAPIHVPR